MREIQSLFRKNDPLDKKRFRSLPFRIKRKVENASEKEFAEAIEAVNRDAQYTAGKRISIDDLKDEANPVKNWIIKNKPDLNTDKKEQLKTHENSIKEAFSEYRSAQNCWGNISEADKKFRESTQSYFKYIQDNIIEKSPDTIQSGVNDIEVNTDTSVKGKYTETTTDIDKFFEEKEANNSAAQRLEQIEKHLEVWNKLKDNSEQYQRMLDDLNQQALPLQQKLEQIKKDRDGVAHQYSQKQKDSTRDFLGEIIKIDKERSSIEEEIAKRTLKPEDKVYLSINEIQLIYDQTSDKALSRKMEELYRQLQGSLSKNYNPYYSSVLHSQESEPIDATLDNSCGIYTIRWILKKSGIDIVDEDAGATEGAIAERLGFQGIGPNAGDHSASTRGGTEALYRKFGLKAERGIKSFEDMEHFLDEEKFIDAYLLRKGGIGAHGVVIIKAFAEGNDKFVITADPLHPGETRKAKCDSIERYIRYDMCVKVSSNTQEIGEQ